MTFVTYNCPSIMVGRLRRHKPFQMAYVRSINLRLVGIQQARQEPAGVNMGVACVSLNSTTNYGLNEFGAVIA
jgi:hypothetical protein